MLQNLYRNQLMFAQSSQKKGIEKKKRIKSEFARAVHESVFSAGSLFLIKGSIKMPFSQHIILDTGKLGKIVLLNIVNTKKKQDILVFLKKHFT